MQLFQSFLKFITDNQLFNRADRLLLAVSGGVDSVVLCELCSRAGFDFAIAHCNFQLRQQESDRDEEFVRKLASHYNAELFVKKMDTELYAFERKQGIQAAARELRYSWFRELLETRPDDDIHKLAGTERELQWILTAHHLDDNVETLLLHFFRGTGIAGLKAISPKQGSLIRPLLFARKEEILSFASSCELEWVEDSSNASDKYTRNFVRQNLLPMVEEVFPGVRERLAGNIARFKDIEWIYSQAISRYKRDLLEPNAEEWQIPVLKLLKINPLKTILYEIIKDFGFSPAQVTDCIQLLHSESGRFIQSATHRILRNRAWLIIAPLNAAMPAHRLIESLNETINLPEGNLMFHIIDNNGLSPTMPSHFALLDAGKISFPLLLRKARSSDYFYPLGLRKKKKLGRFFIDQKLSKTDKEKVWILEMNKTIIWILGMRIDDRFKIGSGTRQILKIEFRKN